MKKMKQANIAALFASVLMVAPFTAFAVAPKSVTVDGGQVNFTGSVHAAPCAIDTSPEQVNISLGQVTTRQLASKGATSTPMNFSIKLVGCDLSPAPSDTTATENYTKATVKFTGSSINNTTLALAESVGLHTAKNVGVQISDRLGKAVNVNGEVSAPSHSFDGRDSGVYVIPFTAAYIATADTVVAGSANSTASFSVTYE